jgi:hypothetical protein
LQYQQAFDSLLVHFWTAVDSDSNLAALKATLVKYRDQKLRVLFPQLEPVGQSLLATLQVFRCFWCEE